MRSFRSCRVTEAGVDPVNNLATLTGAGDWFTPVVARLRGQPSAGVAGCHGEAVEPCAPAASAGAAKVIEEPAWSNRSRAADAGRDR